MILRSPRCVVGPQVVYGGPRAKSIDREERGTAPGTSPAGRRWEKKPGGPGGSPALRTDARSGRVPWRNVPSLGPRTVVRAAGGFGGVGDRDRPLGSRGV